MYWDLHVQTADVVSGIILVREVIACRVQQVLKPKDVVEPRVVNEPSELAEFNKSLVTGWEPVTDVSIYH